MVRRETYWTTITDSEGVVEQELSYDAWGNLRDPETWCVDASIAPMFDRGYTGHEHLSGFGLINMNGRMYDPVMSSFLSVDRYVQQPENSQGFNRYAYCMYNPLKYIDPSGWMMSRPSGSGGIPPQFKAPQPAAVDGGYQVVCIDGMLYGGRLNEVDCIDKAITSSGADSWAREECKTLVWDHNGGGQSAEYSGGEVNVPTIRAGGGGGGGFWTGGNNLNSPSKDYGIASNSLSYGVSYAGVVTSFIKDKWENPGSRAQKAINQKKAYNTQKALKAKGITKSVKEIKAGKITNLSKANHALGMVGLAITGVDIAYNNGIANPSHFLDAGIGVACLLAGPAGWIIGASYLAVDICSYAISGQSIGANIDTWCGGVGFDFKTFSIVY